MKILKKFFALALATVTLSAAVFYVTPAIKSLASDKYSISDSVATKDNTNGEWELVGKWTEELEQKMLADSSNYCSAQIGSDTTGYVFKKVVATASDTYTDVKPATNSSDPTPEKQAAQEQTPASIAAYEQWLATYGGGAATAGTTTQVIAGTMGQAGSEVVISGASTPNGEAVAMFQSNDASNTLVAGAVGAIPTGTKITSAVAAEGSASYTAAKAALGKKNLAFTYDITATAAPTAKFAMSIPVPADLKIPAGKSLKVYAIVDGKATLLDCGVKDGRIVFGTAAFGTFAFVIE
ncbi:MAG: hypothetical protein IJR96_07505 [Pseudobutyrivibrio sp.]|nr:hypothetical protein [Pseudobutyrivibrio sp.]